MFVVLLLGGGGVRERQDNFTISIISNFSIKLGGPLLKAKITRFFSISFLVVNGMCSHSNISKLENFQTDFVLQCNLKAYLQTKNIIFKVHTFISKDSDKNMTASIAVRLLVKLAFMSFDHINKICQGFLFWTWNHLEVFLNTLK